MTIDEGIKSINAKAALNVSLGKKERKTLTRPLLKKILMGIEISRPRRVMADELEITTDLINDVVEEFNIEYPVRARRILTQMEEEFISFKETAHKDTQPLKPVNKQPASPPKLEGVIYTKPKQIKQTLPKIKSATEDDVITNIRQFKSDIEFGFYRINAKYGEKSEYELSKQELREKVLKFRPDILQTDPEYFNVKEIEG